MFISVNGRAFFLRVSTPKHKHYIFTLLINHTNDFIGEFLPALFLMTGCQAMFNRKHTV